MSSPIVYLFINPRYKCVVNIINILSSSKISIKFLMRNTSLPLDGLCYHRQRYCPPSNSDLIMLWRSFLSSLCYVLHWSITVFHVKDVVRIAPPLKNSWYSDTSHHHHSFLLPVLFLTGIPTIELWRVNSKLLATLLLWSEWAIVHSKSFANWITILTLVVQPNPYFGRTFQPMFNCVCFPRAYFLISFDLTNVISLFT